MLNSFNEAFIYISNAICIEGNEVSGTCSMQQANKWHAPTQFELTFVGGISKKKNVSLNGFGGGEILIYSSDLPIVSQ